MPQNNYVTREEIFQAADQVKAEGQQISRSTVRAKLQILFGKSGSDSTLSRYLKEWWLEQPENGGSLIGFEDIPDDCRELFRTLYSKVQTQVQKTYESDLIDSLREQVENLQQQLVDYEFIKGELSGIKIAYQQSLEQIQELTRANERLQKYSDFADLNEPLTAQIEQLSAEVEFSKTTIANLQASEQSAHNAVRATEQALNTALDQISTLVTQVAENQALKLENAHLKQSVTQLEAKNAGDRKATTMLTLAGELVYVTPDLPALIEAEIETRLQSKTRRKKTIS